MKKDIPGAGKAFWLAAALIIAINQITYAEFNYDIDNTIVDQLDWNTAKECNDYKSCVSEYYMLPTIDECMEWEIDPEVLEDIQPFLTNFNGINNQIISSMERYWKRGYYLSKYDLRSAISAFNFITKDPGHDYRIIINYPVDGRKYTFLNMNLLEMDYPEIIKMHKFRGINVDVRHGMIDETVKFFYDWAPSQFESPVLSQDLGMFPTKKIRHDYEIKQYYGWINPLKDEAYIYYLEGKQKKGAACEWTVLLKEVQEELAGIRIKDSKYYDANYKKEISRQSIYSSRWSVSDIMNMIVGSINNNELKKTKVILKPLPKTASKVTVDGILLISEIMNKLGYYTQVPYETEITNILKYSNYIIATANQNNYYRYTGQSEFSVLRLELQKEFQVNFDNTAWNHTVAYLVTSNAVM